MKIIEVSEKNAVELEEYNGAYKLVSCWYSTRDDEWKPQWCTVQIGKEEKKRPMAVYLGDQQTAIKVLQEALAEISGNNKPGKGVPDDEDVPF